MDEDDTSEPEVEVSESLQDDGPKFVRSVFVNGKSSSVKPQSELVYNYPLYTKSTISNQSFLEILAGDSDDVITGPNVPQSNHGNSVDIDKVPGDINNSGLHESVQTRDELVQECELCYCYVNIHKFLPCEHFACDGCIQLYRRYETSDDNTECPVCSSSETANRYVPVSKIPSEPTIYEEASPEEQNDNVSLSHSDHSKSTSSSGKLKKKACDKCKHSHCKCSSGGRNDKDLNVVVKPETCEKHQRTLGFVCMDHLSLACKRCMRKEHHRCLNVMSVDDSAALLSENEEMKNLIAVLKSGKTAFRALNRDLQDQKNVLFSKKTKELQNIRELRQQIDQRLSTLERELREELEQKYIEEDAMIDSNLREMKPFTESIASCIDICESSKINDNNLQYVAAYLLGKSEVESCKDFTNHLSYCVPHVGVDIDDNITNMKFVTSFGVPFAKREPRKLPRELLTWPSFAQRKATEVSKFNLRVPEDNKSCEVQGATFTEQGLIVITDSANNALKIFSKRGKLLSKSTFPDSPFGVCELSNQRLAVSRPSKQVITILDVNTDFNQKIKVSVNSERKTGKPCYGLTEWKDSMVFSSGSNRPYEVHRLSSEREKKCELISYYSHPVYHLNSDRERETLITSVHSRHTADASVYETIGNQQSCLAKSDVIKGARGMDVDLEGNIYVCGYRSSNIVQIPLEGGSSRVILSCEDGIKNPVTLAIHEDHLLVIEESSNKGRLFLLQ